MRERVAHGLEMRHGLANGGWGWAQVMQRGRRREGEHSDSQLGGGEGRGGEVRGEERRGEEKRGRRIKVPAAFLF